jgi:hypothetical protein
MNNKNPKLKFDNSSIPQSGFSNGEQLARATQEQLNFTNNYSSFSPHNTFNNTISSSQQFANSSRPHNSSNSSHMQNLNDYSQLNINQGFAVGTPIITPPSDKNPHSTLDDNLYENINKESIIEIRLNIDSMDRDTKIYPDPFKYTVTFGPVVNSGIDSTIQRSELKNELRNANKKKNLSNQTNPTNASNSVKVSNEDFQDDLLIFSTNPNIIVKYDDKLKRIYNPYITRSFENVKFIRLDNVVLPRFNKVIINSEWNFCNICDSDSGNISNSMYNDNIYCSCNTKNVYVKDDYERTRIQIIKNDRYIPDDNHIGPLFTDRYVLVNIKEIANNNNLATNQINTQAFTIFPDKYMGILYWRGNPYYAVRIYKDSRLGNINRLSFEFFDSWGAPIVLDRICVNYETDQIINTDIINPSSININDVISDPKLNIFFINKMNEVIKCYIMVNYNINCKIPFYFDKETIDEFNKQKICNEQNKKCAENNNNPCTTNQVCDIQCNINKCKIFANVSYPKFNKTLFTFTNIFTELNEFVTLRGFINVQKKTTSGKIISVTINEYINNVFWYNYDKKFITEIVHNITALFNNYKNFGFKILDRLKLDALSIPLNKYFQNHLMFVMGQYQHELSTKINFENK